MKAKKRYRLRPRLAPISISKTAWLYRNRSSINVVAELRNEHGGYITTLQLTILLSKLGEIRELRPKRRRAAKARRSAG